MNTSSLKIGTLKEEVEIGTNVKLNPLCIADRRDEIEFLLWATRRTNQSILSRNIGVTKKRLEKR